ncbi:MAG: site-2 protease family protein, partial [Ruminiclostridium sp.]|nr:site-2 protease family protein [Ruminiclostridium sp.]
MIDILTSGASPQMIIIQIFVFLFVMLVALPLHEYAHGMTAKLLGDDTAEKSGRLTLNPIVHLDPMGAIAMLLFGIGWAKPVPVSPSRCTKVKPKAAMAITALAGPVTNLILGFIAVIAAECILYGNLDKIMIGEGKESLEWYLYAAAYSVARINVYLAVFNMLPIPPFDGSRIFLSFLPTKLYFKVMRYERVIMGIIMILLITGIISLPLGFLTNAIM